MRRLSTHGITREKSLMHTRPKNEIWNYQQIELGFNYRMSDIHAALGLSQMKRLDHNISLRHSIAKRYDTELRDLFITIPFQSLENYSSYHLYPIRLKKNKSNKTQKKIYDKLLQENVGANLHYIPVHLHPYYKKLGFKKNDFPEAERFHRDAISIPLYPKLTKKNQDYVLRTIKRQLLR